MAYSTIFPRETFPGRVFPLLAFQGRTIPKRGSYRATLLDTDKDARVNPKTLYLASGDIQSYSARLLTAPGMTGGAR